MCLRIVRRLRTWIGPPIARGGAVTSSMLYMQPSDWICCDRVAPTSYFARFTRAITGTCHVLETVCFLDLYDTVHG